MAAMRSLLVVAIITLSSALQAQARQEPAKLTLGPFFVDKVIYPPIARAAHVTGDVRVSVTLDRYGVTALEVLDGPVMLRWSALDAIIHWQTTTNPTDAQKLTLTFTYSIPPEGQGAREQTIRVLSDDHLLIETAAPILETETSTTQSKRTHHKR